MLSYTPTLSKYSDQQKGHSKGWDLLKGTYKTQDSKDEERDSREEQQPTPA